MSVEFCKQEKTGSCLGCPILEVIVDKARTSRDRNIQNDIAQTMGKTLCIGEVEIIIPELIRGRQGRLILQERRQKLWEE